MVTIQMANTLPQIDLSVPLLSTIANPDENAFKKIIQALDKQTQKWVPTLDISIDDQYKLLCDCSFFPPETAADPLDRWLIEVLKICRGYAPKALKEKVECLVFLEEKVGVNNAVTLLARCYQFTCHFRHIGTPIEKIHSENSRKLFKQMLENLLNKYPESYAKFNADKLFFDRHYLPPAFKAKLERNSDNRLKMISILAFGAFVLLPSLIAFRSVVWFSPHRAVTPQPLGVHPDPQPTIYSNPPAESSGEELGVDRSDSFKPIPCSAPPQDSFTQSHEEGNIAEGNKENEPNPAPSSALSHTDSLNPIESPKKENTTPFVLTLLGIIAAGSYTIGKIRNKEFKWRCKSTPNKHTSEADPQLTSSPTSQESILSGDAQLEIITTPSPVPSDHSTPSGNPQPDTVSVQSATHPDQSTPSGTPQPETVSTHSGPSQDQIPPPGNTQPETVSAHSATPPDQSTHFGNPQPQAALTTSQSELATLLAPSTATVTASAFSSVSASDTLISDGSMEERKDTPRLAVGTFPLPQTLSSASTQASPSLSMLPTASPFLLQGTHTTSLSTASATSLLGFSSSQTPTDATALVLHSGPSLTPPMPFVAGSSGLGSIVSPFGSVSGTSSLDDSKSAPPQKSKDRLLGNLAELSQIKKEIKDGKNPQLKFLFKLCNLPDGPDDHIPNSFLRISDDELLVLVSKVKRLTGEWLTSLEEALKCLSPQMVQDDPKFIRQINDGLFFVINMVLSLDFLSKAHHVSPLIVSTTDEKKDSKEDRKGESDLPGKSMLREAYEPLRKRLGLFLDSYETFLKSLNIFSVENSSHFEPTKTTLSNYYYQNCTDSQKTINGFMAVQNQIVNGKKALKQVLEGKLLGASNESHTFVSSILWFLMALAINKKQGFVEGAFFIEDNNETIFKFFRSFPDCYPRDSIHFLEKEKDLDTSRLAEFTYPLAAHYGLDLPEGLLPAKKRALSFAQWSGGKNKFIFIQLEKFSSLIKAPNLEWLHRDYEMIQVFKQKMIDSNRLVPVHAQAIVPLDIKLAFFEIIKNMDSKHESKGHTLAEAPNGVALYGISYIVGFLNHLRSTTGEISESLNKTIQTCVDLIAAFKKKGYDNLPLRRGYEVIITQKELSEAVNK